MSLTQSPSSSIWIARRARGDLWHAVGCEEVREKGREGGTAGSFDPKRRTPCVQKELSFRIKAVFSVLACRRAARR